MEEGFIEEDHSPLFKSFKEASYKIIQTSYFGNQDILKLEILNKEKKNLFSATKNVHNDKINDNFLKLATEMTA